MRLRLSLFAVLAACLALPGLASDPQHPTLSPAQALKRLMDGNERYVQHKEQHPDLSFERRRQIDEEGQHPYAVILGCADSRVPPELIFDEGLGDLFVIRDAGNVVDDDVLGSIEYAVEHLGVQLVVVLGHEKCGAVTAAIQSDKAPGHIQKVINSILPAIAEARNLPGDQVHNCVVANAKHVAFQIKTSEPILRLAVETNRIQVVAMDYHLSTGRVEVLDKLKEKPVTVAQPAEAMKVAVHH
ncbi:MAG: carbonic anhydrase [Bryobacteraceae bacterium]|nr:carbonic anhydrase [Solibacteraceae bacterium]MCO5350877.1 carbonic anhydrase [Bryobacteraceae bacterium]